MIKNLLFDLGGVIVDIRRQNCVDAFERLGLQDANSYFGEYCQSGIFMAIEDGSIGIEEFHAELHKLLPENVSDEQIDDAFQQFIIGIPEHRLASLRELRQQGYGIYVLSNTNPIMWNGILEREFRKEGYSREDYFDGLITSFEALAAKPDAAIFHKLVEQTSIKPEETLFFDDSEINTKAAEVLGFKTVHVLPGTEFMDYLTNQ